MLEQVSVKDKELYQKITAYLHAIGLPLHVAGFVYTREAVKLCIKSNSLRFGKVFKKIYEEIAEAKGSTAVAVERNIRHAIKALSEGKFDKVNGVIGAEYFSEFKKPTNSMMITLLADKVAMDLM